MKKILLLNFIRNIPDAFGRLVDLVVEKPKVMLPFVSLALLYFLISAFNFYAHCGNVVPTTHLLANTNLDYIDEYNAEAITLLAEQTDKINVPQSPYLDTTISSDGTLVVSSGGIVGGSSSGCGITWIWNLGSSTPGLDDGSVSVFYTPIGSGPIYDATLTRDNLLLFSLSQFNEGQLWDIERKGKLLDLGTVNEYRSNEVRFSSDNNWLVYSEAGYIEVWNLGLLQRVKRSNNSYHKDASFPLVAPLFDLENGLITTVSEAQRNGKFFYTFYDVIYGNYGIELEGVTDRGSDFVFSSESQTLAAILDDNATIAIWNIRTGKLQSTLSSGITQLIRFDSTGYKLLAGKTLWDLRTGEVLFDLGSIDQSVNPAMISFHPSENILATASKEDFILLWDITTGKVLKKLPIGDVPLYDMEFSPKGNFLITVQGKHFLDNDVQGNNSIKLWGIPF